MPIVSLQLTMWAKNGLIFYSLICSNSLCSNRSNKFNFDLISIRLFTLIIFKENIFSLNLINYLLLFFQPTCTIFCFS
jgi:hypothetical protein